MNFPWRWLVGGALLGLAVLLAILLPRLLQPPSPPLFDGERAYRDVLAQMEFGPRPTGSEALRSTGDYILAELAASGWQTGTQEFTYMDTPVRNLMGRAGEGAVVILGAHYDTRRRADQDELDPAAPVPGANDAASGAAVLLELARSLDKERLHNEVWLVFFDAEDNGGLDDWDWIVGSTYFAEHLAAAPEYVVIVDMVGDADQQIYLDRNSDPALSARIWAVAGALGYSAAFIPAAKYAMFDDHTPFLRRGIPAVDIIDFDYPHWHTAQDTADKVSAASLERVGRTLEVLLETDER